MAKILKPRQHVWFKMRGTYVTTDGGAIRVESGQQAYVEPAARHFDDETPEEAERSEDRCRYKLAVYVNNTQHHVYVNPIELRETHPDIKPFVMDLTDSEFAAFQAADFKFKGPMCFTPHEWESEPGNVHQGMTITLYPSGNTRLEMGYSEPTDEGHHYSAYSIRENGDTWDYAYNTGGTDCDGPLNHCHEGTSNGSPYKEDEAGYHPAFPTRSKIDDERSVVYDRFAQDAGY